MNEFTCDLNDNHMTNLQVMQSNEMIAKNLNFLDLGHAEEPVELQITNLDRAIPPNQLRDILLQLFTREVVPVRELQISFLSDGKPQAIVKLADQEVAQLAIFRLHRKKLGNKRIYLSHRTKSSLCSLKSKVVSVLLAVPGGRIQLLKFRQLYEKRFSSSVKITDLYRMREIIQIQEDVSGRVLQLNPNITNADNLPGLEALYCEKHTSTKELGEDELGRRPLLMLDISLADLSNNVKKLLREHNGRIPMASLTDCYSHFFGENQETSPPNAVPFLHLVTCIKGVRIICDESGVRSLVDNTSLCTNMTQTGEVKETHSQHLANQFSQFSRELVDLLKTWPGCKMPFNKFIPAFHHYFGRQCRVADYGYTKLRDLFEAMPHVVHVLGEGTKAIITLSNRAQMKRFTAEFLKVLKTEKQIYLSNLPDAYLSCNGRPFKISDFGVCRVEDMLDMLPDNTVNITHVKEKKVDGICQIGGDTQYNLLLSLPRRELSSQGLDRIQQFSKEAIDLLKHSPDCTLNFNKFIPAFHHHFGVQCRVSDYGYEKLIDLFEAIPKIVDLSEDADGEKLVELTHAERLKVLGGQLQKLVEAKNGKKGLPLGSVMAAYKEEFGYQLRPDMFKLESVNQLVDLIPEWVNIRRADSQEFLVVAEKGYLSSIGKKILNLLYTKTAESCDLEAFRIEFLQLYDKAIDLETLEKLGDIIVFKEGKVGLTERAVTIKNIESILQDGRLTMAQLECDYEARHKRKIFSVDLGYPDLLSFVSSIQSLSIRGQGMKMTVGLQEYRDSPTISKHCKMRFTTGQGIKRFAMNSPSPETATMPPPPPDSWFKGDVPMMSHTTASHKQIALTPQYSPGSMAGTGYYRSSCPTPPLIYRSSIPTPPPSVLNPCTPPPPPTNWNQAIPSQRDCIPPANYYPIGPVHQQEMDYWKQATFQQNPTTTTHLAYHQGNPATTTQLSFNTNPPTTFWAKVPDNKSFNGAYRMPMMNQGFEPMTPPDGARFNYVHQYQMSPLSRAPPFGSTQFYQFNSARQPDPYHMNGNYQGQAFQFPERTDGYPGAGGHSLFSHSFSVPIPPRSTNQAFPFQGVACSPSVAGSPLSPGLSTGLYHIPPINTNSPDNGSGPGLGDYAWMKMKAQRFSCKGGEGAGFRQ